MKKLCNILIALGLATCISAQSCLPGGITFTRQSQVDSFAIIYPNCTEIEGFLVIGRCEGTDITSLEKLDKLNAVGRFVHIFENDSLPTLNGLHNIRSIGGDLIIGTMLNGVYCGNDMLTDMTGLDKLEYVGGRIVVLGNLSIRDFSGLETLTDIDGAISIQCNAFLCSLGGLENIKAASISELYFVNNPSLSDCNIRSICDYLLMPGSNADFHNNAIGCNDPEETGSACELRLGEHKLRRDTMHIYPNPAGSYAYIELPFHPGSDSYMTIYDQNGRQMILHQFNEMQIMISTDHFPAGIYSIMVCNDKGIIFGKLVKI